MYTKRDWVKAAAFIGVGVVTLFLMWAALWLACVIGVVVAILVYQQHPIMAILGGIAVYYITKEVFFASIQYPTLPPGDDGEERRRIEAATGPWPPPTPDAAARNRGTAAWVTVPVIAIVLFFAYLIFH